MKIKTQFINSMVIFGVMLLIIAASVIFTNQQVERLNGQEEIAKNIERSASELGYLSNDYLLYHESQQRARWESKFSELSDDISSLDPNTPEQQTLVNNIRSNQQRLKAVFTDVVSTFKNTSQDQALFQISWSRMAIQNQGMAFDAERLAQTLRDQENQMEQTNLMLIFALLGIFGAYFFTNYLIVYRRTLRSISDIQAGIRIIGSGNLDHFIKMDRQDEIGDLSRAFNQMTGDLKGVTASKAELEREIAERRRAEEALRESEQKFSTIYQSAPLGIALSLLPEGVLVDVNERFLRMFGYSREEVIGKTSLEIGINPDPQVRERIVNELQQRGFVRNVEMKLFTKSGSSLIVSNNIDVIELGGKKYIISTAEDITERKQSEEALRSSEQRLHLLSELAQEGIVIHDRGMIIEASESLAKMFGYGSASEVIGKSSVGLLTPESQKMLMEHVKTGSEEPYEVVGIKKDGTRFPVEIRPTNTVYKGRQVRTGIIHDLTERKKAEEKIRRHNAILSGINTIFKEALTCETEEELGRTCLRVAEDITGSKFGFIDEIGPDGLLHDIAISDPGWEVCTMNDKTGHRRSPGDFKVHGLYGRVILDGKSFFTNDPATHLDSIGTPEGHPPLLAFLGVPLIDGGKIIGVVGMGNRENGYRTDDLEALEALGAVIVQVFKRKRAEAALRMSNQQLDLLSYTASKLLTSDKPQEIVEELCQRVLSTLDFDAFFNYLVDEEKQCLHLNACAGIPKKTRREIEWLDYGVAVCGCAARDGERIVCENIQDAPDPRAELVRSFGIKAYACHPLFSQGKVIGTLSFGTRSRPGFTEEELALMKTVSEHVAIAMERMRGREELERMVQERTTELEETNVELEAKVDELQRIEAALAAANAYNRSLIEASLDPMVTIGQDGRITDVNAATEQVTGFSRDDLINKDFSLFFTEPGKARKGYQQVFKEGMVRDYPLEIRHNDGHTTPVLYNASVYRDEKGDVTGVFAAARDITEKKRAEEAVRAERQRFNEVLDMLPAYVVLLSPDYHVPFANRFFTERFGQSHGFRCFEYLFKRSEPCEICETYSVLKTRAPHHWEWTGPDGRNYDIFDFPFTDTDGSNLIMEVGIDITERKQAEEKIREQAALLDKAQDAIGVRDLEYRIIYLNKRAQRLYGWTAEEIIGKNADELLYKEKSPQLMEAKKSVIEKGNWMGELRQRTKDGKEIIVEGHWTLVRDNEGKPKSILIINTDITERKKLESQLLQAQRMESIGTLAGGIAHDLNNVLTPIMLSLQMLRGKFKDEQSQKMLSTMEQSSRRGASLIRQVLTFARGVEGERNPVQVKHIISEIEKIAKETFPRNIETRTEIPKDLFTISGDATQVHQVIMNLCVNARDAMPQGGTLSITASNFIIDENYAKISPEAKAGAYIIVTVSDTGTGISPEILDRIFEPFFTTKEHGKGTGLGLSTSMAIVKSHGGFINVYSEVRNGTVFKVYLPAVKSEIPEAEAQDSGLPSGKGEYILVADDEDPIREITISILETYGYKALSAADGSEAVSLYAQNKDKISVVLMDMMMPVMDGQASIQTIRRINPKVSVIAASGLAEKDKLEKIADIQVRAFLQKPYTAEGLLKTIHKILSMKE